MPTRPGERPWPRSHARDGIAGANPRRITGLSRADGIISVVPAGSRQRGFTLIEIIVAFALLALALTLLLGTLSGAARQVRWSADAGRAALHARSLLDEVGVGEPLRAGTRDGEFEDGLYRWTLQVDPYADPARARDTITPGAPRLLRLALDVEWGAGGPRERLQLQTLRLAQPEGL